MAGERMLAAGATIADEYFALFYPTVHHALASVAFRLSTGQGAAWHRLGGLTDRIEKAIQMTTFNIDGVKHSQTRRTIQIVTAQLAKAGIELALDKQEAISREFGRCRADFRLGDNAEFDWSKSGKVTVGEKDMPDDKTPDWVRELQRFEKKARAYVKAELGELPADWWNTFTLPVRQSIKDWAE
jgi:hypothetical protein